MSIERVFDAETSISTIPPPSDETSMFDISVFDIVTDPFETEMMGEERERELLPPVSATSESVSVPEVELVTNTPSFAAVALIVLSVTSDVPSLIVKAVPVRDICTSDCVLFPPMVSGVERVHLMSSVSYSPSRSVMVL